MKLNLKLTMLAWCAAMFTFAQDQAKDPVIMTIDGNPVYQSEFIYIYTKNNPCVSYAKEDLDEYIDLFINYKLKVKEAERLGYDTIPKLVAELKQYRQQLSLPYMIDKEKNESLIKEAYDRTVTEVRASHIMVRLKPDATPADTLAAYEKIMLFRNRVMGGEDFTGVAKSSSEDPSAQYNGGDLGYFSALYMVYPFEDAAYKMNVGDVSMPVRTAFGYHIIKLTDKRPAKGKMSVAHIMIMTDKNMNADQLSTAEQKIKDIYTRLQNGESFEDLAMKYSEDMSSNSKGGKLPEFGPGTKQRMVPQFEEAAYAITEDGKYSEPFKTQYGWHIVKRISLTPIGTYEEMYRELKLKVERDMRAETTRESFIASLKDQYGFSDGSGKLLPIFYNTIGDEIFAGKFKGLTDHANHHEILFTFADKKYTVEDFEQYLIKTQTPGRAENMELFIRKKYDAFVKQELMAYEDSMLESKYPEFKSLMQEYRDGILVFDVMQNEIWNKASKDTAGIRVYYESHRGEFVFPVRYKGELYKCVDRETAEKVIAYIQSDTMDYSKIQMAINTSSELTLMIKRTTFNSETTEAFRIEKKQKAESSDADPCKEPKAAKPPKYRKFKTGLNKMFEYRGEYYVFFVEEVMPPRERDYSEAKGLVTAAYQNQMEEDWLKSLRERYAVVVNYDVLYGLGN
ncbi:MAG: peptidylprolyl isomerase [Crocinitomicaceae bacterium]|nr:peptidylprolyl isomerase [Crocinitomicaceae bacterium]MBK8925516.1 peptidylprolyl isomerase [Crocinitomicaceae bacterium]